MNNINTQKLREAVRHYKYVSKPSSGNKSDSCTVDELEKVISKTAELLTVFIDELEKF